MINVYTKVNFGGCPGQATTDLSHPSPIIKSLIHRGTVCSTHTHTHIHTHIKMYLCACAHTHTHTRADTHMYTHKHMCTYTHTLQFCPP